MCEAVRWQIWLGNKDKGLPELNYDERGIPQERGSPLIARQRATKDPGFSGASPL